MLYSRKETMKVLQIGISSAVLVSLVSCSMFGADSKRIDYGAAAGKVPSLEVPPDLTIRAGDNLKLPQAESGVAAIAATEPAGLASLREISGGSTIIVLNDPFD